MVHFADLFARFGARAHSASGSTKLRSSIFPRGVGLAFSERQARMPLMRDSIIIEPNPRNRQYWFDLWQYRELFRILAWRDLSVRYKQTVVGASWALIRPLLTMLVFTIIFG